MQRYWQTRTARVNLRNIFGEVARADANLGHAAVASDDPVSMLMALSFYVTRPHIGYTTRLRNVIEQHDLHDGNKTVVKVFSLFGRSARRCTKLNRR